MTLLTISTILHLVGAAVGVGAATTSDALFLRSIRNRLISTDQYVLLQGASRVVLAGLALVVLSGLVLVVHNEPLLARPHFQAKMTAVLLLLVNGVIFHAWTLPFLDRHRDLILEQEAIGARLWTFAVTGTMSVVSWYGALILTQMAGFNLSYLAFVGVYLAAVVLGSIFAYAVLRYHTTGEVHDEAARLHVAGRRLRWGMILVSVLLVLLLFTLGIALARNGQSHQVDIREGIPFVEPATHPIKRPGAGSSSCRPVDRARDGWDLVSLPRAATAKRR
ncbi:MAG: hypothetical protein ACK5AZ_14340 [Bryobacteraceae bacterium]